MIKPKNPIRGPWISHVWVFRKLTFMALAYPSIIRPFYPNPVLADGGIFARNCWGLLAFVSPYY